MGRAILSITILLVFTFIVGSCITTTQSPQGDVDLQVLVEQLKVLNTKAIEVKREAALAIVQGCLFDIGFWEVMFKKTKMRPNPEIQHSLKELGQLAERYKQLPEGQHLSNIELGQVLAHWTYIQIGALEHGLREVVPEIVKLLALF